MPAKQTAKIDPSYRLASQRALNPDAAERYAAGDFLSLGDADHDSISREVENITREREDFFLGFASRLSIQTPEATEIWAAYSRQLSDLAIAEHEAAGWARGQAMACAYLRDTEQATWVG